MIVPAQTRGKFLPKIATQLGCKPREHFKVLTAGESVTLDDGKIITPDMVTDKAVPANASLLVFLNEESSIESFIQANEKLH